MITVLGVDQGITTGLVVATFIDCGYLAKPVIIGYYELHELRHPERLDSTIEHISIYNDIDVIVREGAFAGPNAQRGLDQERYGAWVEMAGYIYTGKLALSARPLAWRKAAWGTGQWTTKEAKAKSVLLAKAHKIKASDHVGDALGLCYYGAAKYYEEESGQTATG